jgi:hypothetical protein
MRSRKIFLQLRLLPLKCMTKFCKDHKFTVSQFHLFFFIFCLCLGLIFSQTWGSTAFLACKRNFNIKWEKYCFMSKNSCGNILLYKYLIRKCPFNAKNLCRKFSYIVKKFKQKVTNIISLLNLWGFPFIYFFNLYRTTRKITNFEFCRVFQIYTGIG